MAENTDNTPAAPAAEPAPAPSAPEPAPGPVSEPAGEGSGWKAQILTKPELKEIPRRQGQEEPAGGGDDVAGGYVASSGGGSYASDIAMMRAEADYTSTTVIPHYELLISQAQTAGNGPKTIQALQAGLEAARSALGAAQDAIQQVQTTSEPVQAAYDDAAGEAAKDKAYFEGD